jgi:hypothetical protein
VFDKDMTGEIGVGQLKYILTNLGEKMTDEEVDELLKSVDTSNGKVNYTGTLHLPLQALIPKQTLTWLQNLFEPSSPTRGRLTSWCLRVTMDYPAEVRVDGYPLGIA